MSIEKGKVSITVPLAERDPEQVREALKGQSEFVQEQFVKLLAYAREEGIGVSKLADRTRISQTTISQCFSGTYNGDFQATAERIVAFFRSEADKAEFGHIHDFVELNMSEYLSLVFRKTRQIRRIQVIEGPEQIGKTRAARQFAEANNHGRTCYVSVSGGTNNGVNEFIRRVAEALDLPRSLKMHDTKARIRERLQPADLLLIDESHIIWSWGTAAICGVLDYIRTDLFDNGSRGICILSTNCSFFDRLSWIKKTGHYNVGQFIGRMRAEAIRLDPADIGDEDIRLLAERYYKPGKRVVDTLTEIAQKPQLGHFGLVLDILNEAWTIARRKKAALSDETVQSVATRIMDALKGRKELYI
jgi:hypothetical protein